MIILVLNCGSSSVKYQVMEMNKPGEGNLLAKGLIERIGLNDGIHSYQPAGSDKIKAVSDIPDHTKAIDLIIKAIADPANGVVKSLSDITAVGHRVVFGGETFKDSALITPEIVVEIENNTDLAPLHIPANLKGINAITELLPSVPQVACFDTAFHQTMPAHAYIYAIPYKYYEKYRVRRYGYHGTSHKFVAEEGCKLAGLDINKSKVVTCHIGNGASVTAVMNGRSVDTSMGLTPLEGLIMGTRSGDIDAGAVNYICNKEGIPLEKMWNILNKESGVYGITGISSDMRDIEEAVEAGNEMAKLALDAYYYRVMKYVGAYAAAMGGLDLLVFTGGVGENDPVMRETVSANLAFMGVDFDPDANRGVRSKNVILSKPSSRVRVAAICTNEELVMARDTYRIVSAGA